MHVGAIDFAALAEAARFTGETSNPSALDNAIFLQAMNWPGFLDLSEDEQHYALLKARIEIVYATAAGTTREDAATTVLRAFYGPKAVSRMLADADTRRKLCLDRS